MRKTIIPAAIVLAAPAVTMQAQEVELTFEAIQKEISAVSSAISSYPKDVKDKYLPQLSAQENALRAVKDDDVEKEAKYTVIVTAVAQIKTDAEGAEKPYADARDAALKAIADAKKVLKTAEAESTINALKVPSVRTTYTTDLQALKLEAPAEPEAKDLYESKELSNSMKSDWETYKTKIETLASEATSANKAEMEAQPGRKTTLAGLIETAKGKVKTALGLVGTYVGYTGKDGHLAKINGITAALDDIKADVDASCTNLELTEGKVTEYEGLITAQETTLTGTAAAALTAAKDKAEEDAPKLVSGLTEYTNDNLGPDDYTTAAKNAANDAIKVAKAAAVELGKLYVQNDYNTQADVVGDLVNKANNAIDAVTSCVNNYKAYDNLKKTYETLKAAYDKAAIELSGLKANSQIDDQYYNEANTKLNEVAKMLETFATTNQDKYDKYDGKSNADYSEVMNLLDPAYDEANEIQQIVDKAKTDNATLAKLTGYQTQVQNITATVSHDKADDNEVYAAAVSTLNGELSAKKSALATELAGLVTVWRTNKTLGNKTFADIEKEISDLNAAITTAQADLNAYVSSKEQVATWTASVVIILNKIPDPVSQDYLVDHPELEGDRTQATNYQSAISKLGTDADNAFNDSPRTSKVVWENIQNGTNYTTVLKTLSDNVDKHLTPYQDWLDEQGDVAAYNLGKQYYTELQADLKAAKNATADDALGFSDDQTAITALKVEVDKHGTKGHNPNDCIAAMANWKARYDSIQTTIAAHKQAWLDNKTVYAAKKDTLGGILTFESQQYDLYTKLNNTTQIDDAIKAAQSELETANKKQDAASFGAAAKQTEILNLIAQLKLREELAASGIGGDEGAINYVRTQLATKGWNPNNVYSTKLNTLETEYTTFTANVQYADYQTKHDRIDNLKEGNLKAAILAVATDAKANFDAYTTQTNAQTAAKAVWADIYSKVGAMYVDAEDPTDFSRAQKLYQGDLNKCFTVLTGYDTEIDNAYNTGKSASFNTETYDKAIAKNKAAMDGIYKAAYENKAAYDGQMEKFGQLETYYSEQIDYLDTQIAKVIESINTDGATDKELESLKAQLESLKAQKEALEAAQTDLAAVQTDIDDLKTAVVTAVNERRSVAYNNDKVEGYDAADDNIRSAIDTIISKADGSYNDNIVAHNTVVKELFLEAYNAAKEAYNKHTFQIDEYAGYTHALNDNGVSAYAEEIEKAQKAIFGLNTQLVAKYNVATSALSSTTEYVDKEQQHKKDVNDLKDQLDAAYNDFLDATKAIADANKYAKPLSDLADYYTNAKTAIAGYDIITGITATPDEVAEGITDAKKQAAEVAKYFTFDGKVLNGMALNAAYTDAGNAGPQLLDDLRAKAKDQTDQVKTAWNDAAKKEANHALANDAKEGLSDLYNSYIVLDYPIGYTDWNNALTVANQAISDANAAIVTMNYEGLADIKSGITTAKTKLEAAKSIADEKCDSAKKDRGTFQERIGTISSQIDSYRIGDYANYAKELSGLITAAETAVSNANKANTAAYNALYKDTESNSALDKAIEGATTALTNLKTKAEKLVQANQPASIVATLLAKAQELMPLYNRAEGNATGNKDAEKKCVEIYKDLNTLLTTLADGTKQAEIVANKTTYEAQIESLKTRIIAADLEQVAYTDLLEKQAKVAQELEAVKTTISGSVFADALNTTFKADLDGIAASLSAAATQINIDHANNRCGKEGAYSLEQLAGISTEISNLSAKVDAEIAKLAKAEADEATRTANKTAYDAATAVISELSNELVAQWCVAQGQNLDVYTLFAEKVTTLHTEIEGLQTSLDAAYEAAQNVNGDPSKLDTSDYTTNSAKIQSYYTRIEKLMGEISASQTQFEADVTSLKEKFEAMNTAFLAIKISDVAAENEDVQKEKDAIDAAIREIKAKMQEENFGPKDIETVQGLIDAANDRITAFATLVAGKTYVPGDITGTGSVDINDTFKILDFILEDLSGDTLDENVRKAADMDGDGAFTVADLVQINNLYVYGSKTGPQGSNKVAAAADAEVGSVDMQLDTDRMSVLLDSNTGYSAIQMDVEMPQGVSINEVNFAGDSQKVMVATNTLENGVQRIVIYSTDGSNILNGETSLINLGLAGEGMGIVGIDNIIASTAAGQRHNLMGVTGAYTIVTGIEATETAEGNTSVFDINGMVRKTVQKGVNIVKDAAGKVKKMLMK